jgi:hypothetical protein
MEGFNPLDLSHFNHIIEFSWTGVQSKEDFEALRDCLRINAQHLKSLSLNLIDWEKADDFWFIDHSRFTGDGSRSRNFFVTDIISLEQSKTGLSFPSLESLSLSALSFESAINDIFLAFNFSGLRKLMLWKCKGILDLLDKWVDSDEEDICLTSLEIVVNVHQRTDMMDEEEPISRFL